MSFFDLLPIKDRKLVTTFISCLILDYNVKASSTSFACSSSPTYGFTSSGVNDCREKGGGLVGNGCVGDVFSPGTVDCDAVQLEALMNGLLLVSGNDASVALAEHAAS